MTQPRRNRLPSQTRYAQGHRRRRSRLRLEPLEARRLLAGIQVSVFVDADASRSYEAGDAPAANRLVFLDLNENGTRDGQEPIAVTDAAGLANFDGIEAGDYQVGLITNPNSQRQTTATRVSPVTTARADESASWLLASDELELAWRVDASGTAVNLANANESVDLGGPVTGYVSGDEFAKLLVHDDQLGETVYRELNLATGALTSATIDGLQPGERISQLVANASDHYVLIGHTDAHVDGEHSVGKLQIENGSVTLARTTLSAMDLVGSPADSIVALLKTQVGEEGLEHAGSSEIQLVDYSQAEPVLASLTIDGQADSLEISADGRLLFVEMTDGGVQVLEIDGPSLRLEALLAEAVGPVSAQSADGRVLTGSASQPSELILWDSSSWLPTGITEVGGVATSLVTDGFGEVGLVATDSSVVEAHLAIPKSTPVRVTSEQSIATTRIGVRVSGDNTAPDVSTVTGRELVEDAVDALSLTDDGVWDADGDFLWYSLGDAPENGRLELSPNGIWQYTPDADYFGNDEAIVRVHDGLDTSELKLNWDVAPVNDPPISIIVNISSLPEDAEPGDAIGFVSVVDADPDASYEITTSDARFVVEGAQVLFAGGELDFDTNPEISFEILATDTTLPAHAIQSIASLNLTDVNEPPVAIVLEQNRLNENSEGVDIGSVVVEDPDFGAQYSYTVSDERFEVVDGVLRLVAGATLDHETEPRLLIDIAATEVGGNGDQITQQVELIVQDQNDPPSGIVLTSAELEGSKQGAVVGEILVSDEDGDAYNYQVSDERFHVVDGVLRLKDGEEIPYEGEETGDVAVTVTATAANGDSTQQRYQLAVLPPVSPFHNQDQPTDVNGDGVTTPIDALILINRINRFGPYQPQPPVGGGGEGTNPGQDDVNNDGHVTPLDALIIINELNERKLGGGEGESLYADASDTPPIEYRDQSNEELDSELEQLLEQLSRHRLA